jgi:hypothetical protein
LYVIYVSAAGGKACITQYATASEIDIQLTGAYYFVWVTVSLLGNASICRNDVVDRMEAGEEKKAGTSL